MPDPRFSIMKKVKEWADGLFPCEAPDSACDSFGTCDNCHSHGLVMAGASKVCKILFDGSPDETDKRTNPPFSCDEYANPSVRMSSSTSKTTECTCGETNARNCPVHQ